MRQSRSSSSSSSSSSSKDETKADPTRLSGAYIRSLVKQLTSSKTKTKDSSTMNNPKEDNLGSTSLTKFGNELNETQNTQKNTQQPLQHKKQVRRRLHTTKPYQERLLNMAEARREIVTALKFHRASMKQQQQYQQQDDKHKHYQQQSQVVESPQINPSNELQEGRIKSRRNPRIYPSNTVPYNSNFPQQYNPPTNPNPFYNCSVSPITNSLQVSDNPNFPLPNQTLGLNLNFHDFNNIESSLYQKNNNNRLFYSTSIASPSSSSSPNLSVITEHEVSGSVSMSQNEEIVGTPILAADNFMDSSVATSSSGGGGGLHAAMDEEEIAEIRSIGEQYQMEWNDTMNLVTSAWWFKFLKSMELGGSDVNVEDNKIDGFNRFDQDMEFPSWLSVNDTSFQHHYDYYPSDDYFQDSALPRMDIGEIEGMDGDWLA